MFFSVENLKANKEKLEKLEKELAELKDKQRLLDAEYDMFKLALEKRKVLNSTIEEMNDKLKQLKDDHSKNLDALLIFDVAYCLRIFHTYLK